MALPEEPLSIVEQWKKKSYEMSSVSNDSVVSLLTRSIDTMAVVLNKKSDFDKVQRALMFLESERSLSFQLDKNKNDEVRSLVYGQIECLHFALHELTKERNQVKECGEMFTQTDQEVSDSYPVHSLTSNQMKESSEMFTQTDQNWLEVPKEELFDEDIWGGELAIKDEDIPYEDVNTHKDGDLAGDSEDVVDYARAQSEVSALNNMGADFANEDVDDTMNDSMANEIIGEDKESSVRAQSAVPAMNYIGDEPVFENEDNDETMNEKDNETIEEDGAKDLSETVEVAKRRRSSRNVSRTALVDNFSDFSNENYEPTMKKPKANSSKMKIRKSSDTVEKKRGSLSSKRREMKCIECEAGLALRCDCGIDTFSHQHRYECDIANFTVVRHRDGPIQRINEKESIRRSKDEKATPQCIQCEAYPTTADGYVTHLYRQHNSYLRDQGIFLLCKCGARYRNSHPDSKHTEECTRRQFTLHKVADK